MSADKSSHSTSDLIDAVHHEHEHLRRLFDDLAVSFESVARGEVQGEDRKEMVANAAENLEVALEDMMEHFNQEEEVFFVELEERFPEMSEEITGLIKGHETMSQRARWLHEQLGRPVGELDRNVDVLLDVVRSLSRLVEEHTRDETAFLDAVLDKVPTEERRVWLEKMREI